MNILADPRIPHGAIRLYFALCRFHQGRNGAFPSLETLSKATGGMPESTIKKYRALLRRCEYITVQRRKDMPAVIRVVSRHRAESGVPLPAHEIRELSNEPAELTPESTPYIAVEVTRLKKRVTSTGENTHTTEVDQYSGAGVSTTNRNFQGDPTTPDGGLIEDLEACGFNRATARAFVQSWPARRIRAAVIACRRRGDVMNGGAWIRRAVVEDWKHPWPVYQELSRMEGQELTVSRDAGGAQLAGAGGPGGLPAEVSAAVPSSPGRADLEACLPACELMSDSFDTSGLENPPTFDLPPTQDIESPTVPGSAPAEGADPAPPDQASADSPALEVSPGHPVIGSPMREMQDWQKQGREVEPAGSEVRESAMAEVKVRLGKSAGRISGRRGRHRPG